MTLYFSNYLKFRRPVKTANQATCSLYYWQEFKLGFRNLVWFDR